MPRTEFTLELDVFRGKKPLSLSSLGWLGKGQREQGRLREAFGGLRS